MVERRGGRGGGGGRNSRGKESATIISRRIFARMVKLKQEKNTEQGFYAQVRVEQTGVGQETNPTNTYGNVRHMGCIDIHI